VLDVIPGPRLKRAADWATVNTVANGFLVLAELLKVFRRWAVAAWIRNPHEPVPEQTKVVPADGQRDQ
jgi:hypothetical protein